MIFIFCFVKVEKRQGFVAPHEYLRSDTEL